MLIDKLLAWDYYEKKIPLYLRNSYGIVDHFIIVYECLTRVNDIEDTLIKALDIFDENYLTFINELDTSDTKDKSDILDKLGKLYGLNRDFDVTYLENSVEKTASLHLNNAELLKLIKARIIQNNYTGTYKESRELYEKIELPIYILQTYTAAYAYLFLDESSSYTLSENEKILFLAGFFTLKSMGIRYATATGDISELALWDSSIDSKSWDVGRWS